jgi:hypothetical protein
MQHDIRLMLHGCISVLLFRLRHHFTAQLVESGWRDNMKDMAKDVIQQHGGLTRFTLNQLIEELVPRGRSTVPPALKEEMMEKLRQVVREQKRR